MNWLLTVSDDGKPDFIVGIPQNWFFYAKALFIGIIIGIIISFWFCQIKNYIKSKPKEENKSNSEDNDEEQ